MPWGNTFPSASLSCWETSMGWHIQLLLGSYIPDPLLRLAFNKWLCGHLLVQKSQESQFSDSSRRGIDFLGLLPHPPTISFQQPAVQCNLNALASPRLTSQRWRSPSPLSCTTPLSVPKVASSARSWRSVVGSTSTSPQRAQAAIPSLSEVLLRMWTKPRNNCCTWQRRR